jgi:folate-dependent phosphoribosylglycinamide formyltransferase PurN
MRVVVLCSSPYSETGCAMAARLAQAGHGPAGALSLPALDRATLLRKFAQWGIRDSARFAWSKLAPRQREATGIRNPYLGGALQRGGKALRSLHEAGSAYGFPVVITGDQNSPAAIERLRQWSPDVAVFTGGNILRKALLGTPRLGVINAHLALLPKIRGMSSPEWSLLQGVPLGVTIHFMDTGIDTGPVLLRREFRELDGCDSFSDLRNRMIAFGMEMVVEAIAGLETGTITPRPQTDQEKDNQFFVMHAWLKEQAAARLGMNTAVSVGESSE